MIAIMLLKVLVTFTSFAFVSWIYQQHTHVPGRGLVLFPVWAIAMAGVWWA